MTQVLVFPGIAMELGGMRMSLLDVPICSILQKAATRLALTIGMDPIIPIAGMTYNFLLKGQNQI